MLLTNKAKKDFLKWYSEDKTYSVENFMLQKLYASSELVQNTYIIQWFDSVGIYINIYHDFNGRFFFNIDNADSTIKSNFGTDNYNNRIECTRKSIEHANELYNN